MSRETNKKPGQLRADALPTEGYVLQVDGKMKTRYDTADAAMTAATKLKRSYPVIQTKVYDAASGTYALVELPDVKANAKSDTTADEKPGAKNA